MTPTEKAIRDFCGHHADWWPSTTQVQEMLALAQPEQEPVAWISQNAGLYHGKPDESINPLPLYFAPFAGDIRALKHRIHELEGELLGYKKIVADQDAMLERQTARIVDLQEHIENFDGEDR
jgi:hypothetical protein